MSMFRHHDGIAPTELDALQLASDQKTEAEKFITDTHLDLAVQEQTHLWHADNVTLVRLGLAANALLNDCTAEILRQECTTGEGKRQEMSPDAYAFAFAATQNARQWMDRYVDGFMPTQDASDLDLSYDQIFERLNPEIMLPYWPRTTEGAPTVDWQGRGAEVETPVVTINFIRAITVATREIQGRAFKAVQQLSNPTTAMAPVPPEYASMYTDIVDNILNKGCDARLQSTESLLEAIHGTASDDTTQALYTDAHEAYIHAANAWVGAICPPTLGEQYYPSR